MKTAARSQKSGIRKESMQPATTHLTPREAVCIGCGCSDNNACVTTVTLDTPSSGLQGCFWVKVDYAAGIGVCSECVEHIGGYEARMNLFHREGAKGNVA